MTNEAEESSNGAMAEEFMDEVPIAAASGNAQRTSEGPKGGVGFHRGCFIWLVAVLVIITGATIAIVFAFTGDKAKDEELPPPGVTVPSQSPISLSPAQTENREEFLEVLAFAWSGEDVYGGATAARAAYQWLRDTDPQQVDQATDQLIIKQRYIAAVIYYSLQGQFWDGRRNLSENDTIISSNSRKLQELGFLSASDVCEWNDGIHGILCDGNDNILQLLFRKS